MNWRSPHVVFYSLLAAITLVFGAVAVFTDGTGGNGDSICHYLIARASRKNPIMFFDHWGKPLYTLLSAPFAYMGFKAVKCFNIIISSIACAFTYQTAVRLKMKNAFWVILFYFLSSEFYEVTFTAFTEPVFALVFAAGMYYLSAEKNITGTVILSFLPFARSEGLVILCVLLCYLLYLRQYKIIPLLLTGHVVYSIAGSFFYHDFLWVFTQIPYARLDSVYGHGQWNHFLRQLYYMFGPVSYALVGIALLRLLLKFARNPLSEFRNKAFISLLFLSAGFFVAFLFAHSLFWALGIFGSLGLTRVFIGVIPAWCLLSLIGLNTLCTLAMKIKFAEPLLKFMLLTGMLYSTFFYPPTSMKPEEDLYLNEGQRIQAYTIAPYIHHKFPGYNMWFSELGLSFFLDRNFKDGGALPLTFLKPDYRLKEKELFIWDDMVAGGTEGINLDSLKNKPYLKLDTTFSSVLTNRDTFTFCVFVKR